MGRTLVELMPSLFDSHCHLQDEQFDSDREDVLARMQQAGVFAALTCGSDIKTSKAGLDLARKNSFLYAAVGIHPHEAAKAGEDDFKQLPSLLRHEKVVALGEIGLDFYYDFSPRKVQEEALDRQIALAYAMNLPVILHVREAHGAMLDFLRARKQSLPKGVLHCFSGSAESALEYEKLGFYISFAGSLTFKNAENLRRSAQAVSQDRLLVETDSPYLAPVPFRGKRNEPAKVLHVCEELAKIRHTSVQEMAQMTKENASRLFGIMADSDRKAEPQQI